jgi:hypothetical protein
MKRGIVLIPALVVLSIASLALRLLFTASFGVQTYTFRKSFPNAIAVTLDSIKDISFKEVKSVTGKVSAE